MTDIEKLKFPIGKYSKVENPTKKKLDTCLSDIKNFPNKIFIEVKNIFKKDFNKTFIHSNTNKNISLKENIDMYAWHCNHHLAHIVNAKKHIF